MDLILEHYQDMVDFANTLIYSGQTYKLYCGNDVVHDIIDKKLKVHSVADIKRLIWSIIRDGCINATWIGASPRVNLQDKHCSECKNLKIISEFQLTKDSRREIEWVYYSAVCKKCLDKKNRLHKKTPKGRATMYAYQSRRNKEQADQLTDYYIRTLIKNACREKGIKITSEEITDQQITLKRQEIIARRATKTP